MTFLGTQVCLCIGASELSFGCPFFCWRQQFGVGTEKHGQFYSGSGVGNGGNVAGKGKTFEESQGKNMAAMPDLGIGCGEK